MKLNPAAGREREPVRLGGETSFAVLALLLNSSASLPAPPCSPDTHAPAAPDPRPKAVSAHRCQPACSGERSHCESGSHWGTPSGPLAGTEASFRRKKLQHISLQNLSS